MNKDPDDLTEDIEQTWAYINSRYKKMDEIELEDGTVRRLGNNEPPEGLVSSLNIPLYGTTPTTPIIPRDKWKVTDLSRFTPPIKDQDGIGACLTADTEVLTDKGWVGWPDYNGTDLLGTVNPTTHMLEFQKSLKNHVIEHDGEMVYSTNRRIDFGVTPDHRMYLRKWDEKARTLSDDYSFTLAKDIGWYAGLLDAPSGFVGTGLKKIEIEGDRVYDGDDFMALLGLITSDGYAGGADSTKNHVAFCN